MATSFAKNFPQISSPPIDMTTGQWNPEWLAFFIKIFQSTGGAAGSDPTNMEYAAIQASTRQPLPALLTDYDAGITRRASTQHVLDASLLSDQVASIKRGRLPQLKLSKTTYPALTLIQLWSGTLITVPAGFQLCDGSAGSPDLRNLFVIGAGGTYAVGATGGSTTIAANNLPAHTHLYDRATDNVTNLLYTVGVATLNVDTSLTQTPTASGANTTTASAYLQPYYAAAYIINTAEYVVINNVVLEN